jgi:serine/threonine-protein kinase
LKKNEKVNLTVSLGVQAAIINIPSVKGMTLTAATSELQALPYLLHVKTGFLQTAPPGVTNLNPNVVISQVPAAHSKAHTGDTITLYVLSPNAQFTMPPLLNDSTNQAALVLGQYNLTLSSTVTKACSNTVPIGDVISSTPSAGSFVNAGDQVALTTSSGYCKVQVPSVLDDSQAQATQILDGDQFQVSVSPTDPSICAPSDIGKVSDQSLAPSTYALFKSTITISVCDASTESTSTTTTTTIP